MLAGHGLALTRPETRVPSVYQWLRAVDAQRSQRWETRAGTTLVVVVAEAGLAVAAPRRVAANPVPVVGARSSSFMWGGAETELQHHPLIYFMLPKTQFHYSPIYFEHLALPKNFVMPTDKFIHENTRKLELKWRRIEKKILKEIENATGLKWQESHIYIYITSDVGWFSAPLTMSITEDTDVMLDMLIHELIHRILSENENWVIIKRRWVKLLGKYKKENTNARIHVPIHAIHKHIFLKFFNQKRLELEIKRVKDDKDYARAWEIVQSGDYTKIIKALNPKFNI